MKSTLRIVLTLAIVLAATRLAQAESSWSWKNWMPFGAKSDQTARKTIKKKTEPSMVQRFNRGTKSFFVKSKEAVPPWLMPDTQKKVRESSAEAKRSAGNVKKEVRTARTNMFAPWSEPKEIEEKPTTVPDWLALPKPE